MHVSTLVRWGAALTAMGLAVTACSESPSAPQPPAMKSAVQLTDAWLLANGGPTRDGRGRKNKSDAVTSQDFVVDPSSDQTIRAGNHTVFFPANSICDPATSGYGEDMWDAPCDPLQAPITLHVTWSSKYGHAFIDFQPALRFVPTSDPARYVMITMRDDWDLDPSYHYPIFWQRPSDGDWVDESLNDPSMTSVVDLPGNHVARRLKHFIGYLVGVGEICDAWSSVDCAPLSSFAGYLLGF